MKRLKMKYCAVAAVLSAAILTGCSSDQVADGSTSTSGVMSTEAIASLTTEPVVDNALETEPLSEAKKREMKDAWRENKEDNLVWDAYYGTYDGCIVVLDPGNLTAIRSIEVAGYNFIFGNSFTIWVYRNGEFYKLEEAYEAGILIETQIAAIFERHADYLKEKFGEDYYNALYGENP